jgi:pyruvate formate lyase activating enzyme
VSYTDAAGVKLQCRLCPHNCLIADGESGICQIRLNRSGDLSLPYYGSTTGTSIDPIEKKPLYHFFPGSSILSIGFFGCNFRCPFCQNYSISQTVADHAEKINPDELVELALKRKSFGIAYTYSEPVVHFEYVTEAASLAKRKGLKNVLVSNGFLNPEPAAALLDLMDAANIDLKSFNPDFYKREIGGNLAPVLEFLKIAAQKVLLEVTTLVIPGKNDGDGEIEEIASFIASLSPDIPLHLSCYYPTFKYSIEATTPDAVFRLAGIAKKHLRFVYPGNVGLRETNTNCPSCGALLIQRSGYATRIQNVKEGRCTNCGLDLPIAGL